MLEDLFAIVSVIFGFVLFFIFMKKINNNSRRAEAMSAVGFPAFIIVFSTAMAIALVPYLLYEKSKKSDFDFDMLIESTWSLVKFIF